jgi:thioredoxin-dependent peroxiredoxin
MSARVPVKVHDKAPDFTLQTHDGGEFTLSKAIGERAVVLFFYPKDDSPGCTVEACSFRDNYDAFTAAGALVVGVSSDSVASHAKFAGKHRLPMTLLSDERGEVRSLYGIKATLGLIPGRATFIIDRSGVVRHIFSSQLRVSRHVHEALSILKGINSDGSDGAGTARSPL